MELFSLEDNDPNIFVTFCIEYSQLLHNFCTFFWYPGDRITIREYFCRSLPNNTRKPMTNVVFLCSAFALRLMEPFKSSQERLAGAGLEKDKVLLEYG
jgi:hypothetical protein